MTDEQRRPAGYRLSGRGLLYCDETGRERLAVVYWLTKLGTKTRWMLSLGAVGFIGLGILGAALDSTEDPLAGLTPEQVVSVHATATQEEIAAQEEEARQEEIAAQEEKERAYMEALEEAAARQTAEAPKPTPEPTEPPPPQPTEPPPQANCHPSYEGACLLQGIGDYDCAGGSGNGPNYTGRVRVVGPDVFDLDRDNDGIGCE